MLLKTWMGFEADEILPKDTIFFQTEPLFRSLLTFSKLEWPRVPAYDAGYGHFLAKSLFKGLIEVRDLRKHVPAKSTFIMRTGTDRSSEMRYRRR